MVLLKIILIYQLNIIQFLVLGIQYQWFNELFFLQFNKFSSGPARLS
jgi:hypothetical protein